MAAGQISVTEGSGKNIATHEISETTTKQIQRVAINNSSGTDISPLSESDFDTKIGSLTETAPATDTASSGLNGRLQRIAQRITSLIALVPAALTGSGNFKVAVQEELPAGTQNIGDVDIASALPAGTNNIGDVDVLTVPADPFGANADAAATAGATGSIQAKLRLITSQLDAIKTAVETLDNTVGGSELQVDVVAALPSGTNLLGKVSASAETSTVYDGTTALTPKFAIIDAATSGDNTLVAAVNPKKIRVLALMMVAAGAVNARFESGASGTALSGQMNLTTNSGFTLPYNPLGWFETTSNTLLNLELSAATSVDGMLVYVEV